jgi:uncharacterized membrane protein
MDTSVPLIIKNKRGTNALMVLRAILVVTLGSILIYWPVISINNPNAIPWGSDTLGHVSRLEFLTKSIQQGIYIPDIYPSWYLGMQLFRYYPPLTYYFLILIDLITRQAVLAVNWLIFLCALIGGLSFLLYKKWIGWLPAIGGGLIYLILPDNVRVAFSEGNLPRVLASAFVPLLFYLMLDFFERPQHQINLVGISAIFLLFVFCHPMMAAIYAIFAAIIALLSWLVKMSNWRSATLVIACIALGIGLAGWWLLPSLTGGITELNATAVTQALPVSSLSTLLNPLLRLRNPEIEYSGLSLVVFSLAALFSKNIRDKRTIVFTAAGLAGILAYTPFFNEIFKSLPAHNLLWPSRFQGISSFLILLSSLWFLRKISGIKKGLIAILLFAVMITDVGLSKRLIATRLPSADLVAVSTEIGAQSGWREVTLDKSKLGSQASYFIDENSQREQVFGWAYQGAKTAKNVAGLNDAMDFGAYTYLLDRLALFGVDDVIMLNDAVPSEVISPILISDNFSIASQNSFLTHLHRDGLPRAVIADYPGMAIGKGAVNYSFLFPQIVQGNSNYIDDYSLEQLEHYKTLVLSGFSWHDKNKVEALVQAVADQDVNIVIDLTQTQLDPVAQIAQFLGVWGEPIIMDPNPVTVDWKGQRTTLMGFGKPNDLWYTQAPQGVDQNEATLQYLGQTLVVIGSINHDNHKIWFLGLNLVYHALETRDPEALKMLSDVLQFVSGAMNHYRFIPLDSYTSGPNGYEFTYNLDQPVDLLVPIARFDGTRILVDGKPIPIQSIENLILFAAPAGEHHVRIDFMSTVIYNIGVVTTIISGIVLVILMIARVTRYSRERTFHEKG